MERLEGKVALVTGASGGIGAAVARSLADQGVRLGLASRSGADLGIDGAVARPCDVRDPAAIRSLTDEVVERFGGLDIVVVNAGVGAYGPFLDLPDDEMEEIDRRQREGHPVHAFARRSRTCCAARPPTSSRSPRRRAGAGCRSRPSTARRSSRRWG